MPLLAHGVDCPKVGEYFANVVSRGQRTRIAENNKPASGGPPQALFPWHIIRSLLSVVVEFLVLLPEFAPHVRTQLQVLQLLQAVDPLAQVN